MADIKKCGYIECYYNNNIVQNCVKDTITVSATSECETLMHCDEFECIECDMFDVCSKDKKNNYVSDN